jgi:peptidoglycan/xylan/chitin deacetylase (PgdA/CDA1 family)
MYHHVDRPPADERNKKLWVSEKKFAQHLAYLKRHGYHSITFRDVESHLREGRPLPEQPLIITFDDGAEDVYTRGFPILKKYGFGASVFLISEQSTLGIDQIKEMQAYGIEFGSHTKTHPNLLQMSRDEAAKEIQESRWILEERLNERVIAFAYPYGQGAYDERIKELVREGGYLFGCGIKRGKLTFPITNPYSLNRILIRGDDFMVDFLLCLKKGRSRL